MESPAELIATAFFVYYGPYIIAAAVAVIVATLPSLLRALAKLLGPRTQRRKE